MLGFADFCSSQARPCAKVEWLLTSASFKFLIIAEYARWGERIDLGMGGLVSGVFLKFVRIDGGVGECVPLGFS